MIRIAQGLLAAVLVMAGPMKLAQPKERLAASGQAWVEDFDAQQVKGIGVLEVLAAIGLLLPAALDLVPILTAIVASGVVPLRLGAGATHLRRGEPQLLPVNVLIGALALFIAIERFGPHSLCSCCRSFYLGTP